MITNVFHRFNLLSMVLMVSKATKANSSGGVSSILILILMFSFMLVIAQKSYQYAQQLIKGKLFIRSYPKVENLELKK